MIHEYFNKIKELIDKILYPQFIQKMDKYFLLNHPRIWILKLHYVCYYALLINILIICLILIFPTKPLSRFLFFKQIGILIFSISEIIFFIYWWYKQSRIEKQYKQYNKHRKSNAFLEILGYSACLILIASAMIIFALLIECKGAFIILEHEIITDVLIIDLLEENIKDNSTSIKSYVNNLKNHMEQKKGSKQNYSGSCFETYYQSYIYNHNSKDKEELELKALLKTINCDNMLDNMLEYDKVDELTKEVLNNFLKNEGTDSDKIKYIENGVKKSVESLENNETKEIRKIIFQYTGKNLSAQQQKSADDSNSTLQNTLKRAYDIYFTTYDHRFLKGTLLSNYWILSLLLLLLFLYKNTYSNDLIVALIYLFGIIVIFAFTVTFFSHVSFGSLKQNNLSMILIFLITFFNFCQTLPSRKVKKYSRFKTLNFIVLPFMVYIFIYDVLFTLDDNISAKINNYIPMYIIYCLGSLVYLPLISYVKSGLIKQLSLPKD